MNFHSPWSLLLLLLLPVLAFVVKRKDIDARIKFSSVDKFASCPVSWRIRLRPMLLIIRFVCLALLIFALARPRRGTTISQKSTEGVAIQVVLDRSGSMAEQMGSLNRLEVAKRVLTDFVRGDDKNLKGRPQDLIGLITFARYADTKCPLVHAHDAMLEFMNKTQLVQIRSEDGTAIGDALSLGAARLRKAEEELVNRRIRLGIEEDDDFKIKSKVIILLTDGNNNAGQYQPLEAAKLAKEWGIKIYTIGIGSEKKFFGMPMGSALDERLLKAIAEGTGGFYGRADDAKALESIIEKIDELEKTKVKSIQYTHYAERFGRLAFWALMLLMIEIILTSTVFRKIP
jgi:Ca-activated chloride channel family protein